MIRLMSGIGRKKLNAVSDVGAMMKQAIKGNFGCLECPRGAVTMWRNDDGMYCVTAMRCTGFETSSGIAAMEWAEDSRKILSEPER
jgi:hypothetical protein